MEEIFFEFDLEGGSVIAHEGQLYEIMSFNEKTDKYICRPMTDGIWLKWVSQKYPKLVMPINFSAQFQAGAWIGIK